MTEEPDEWQAWVGTGNSGSEAQHPHDDVDGGLTEALKPPEGYEPLGAWKAVSICPTGIVGSSHILWERPLRRIRTGLEQLAEVETD